MTDKEIHDYLVKMIGVNYHNYPKCVEYNIKVMKYLNKRKKEKNLESKNE